jgi:hypothetical protein
MNELSACLTERLSPRAKVRWEGEGGRSASTLHKLQPKKELKNGKAI